MLRICESSHGPLPDHVRVGGKRFQDLRRVLRAKGPQARTGPRGVVAPRKQGGAGRHDADAVNAHITPKRSKTWP